MTHHNSQGQLYRRQESQTDNWESVYFLTCICTCMTPYRYNYSTKSRSPATVLCRFFAPRMRVCTRMCVHRKLPVPWFTIVGKWQLTTTFHTFLPCEWIKLYWLSSVAGLSKHRCLTFHKFPKLNKTMKQTDIFQLTIDVSYGTSIAYCDKIPQQINEISDTCLQSR